MHAVRWSIFVLRLVSSPLNLVSIPSRQLSKHCTLVVRASRVLVMSDPGVDVARVLAAEVTVAGVLAAEVTLAEVVPSGRLIMLDWVPRGIKELVVLASPCVRLSSGL